MKLKIKKLLIISSYSCLYEPNGLLMQSYRSYGPLKNRVLDPEMPQVILAKKIFGQDVSYLNDLWGGARRGFFLNWVSVLMEGKRRW